jgi:hypothetical protein
VELCATPHLAAAAAAALAMGGPCTAADVVRLVAARCMDQQKVDVVLAELAQIFLDILVGRVLGAHARHLHVACQRRRVRSAAFAARSGRMRELATDAPSW